MYNFFNEYYPKCYIFKLHLCSIGVDIIWDGASYVEVELSSVWQNKTCGLCGNFNKNPKDELTTRQGIEVNYHYDLDSK